MELEDIVYELVCLHESMLFCCMALRRIIRDLEEAEQRIRAEAAAAEPPL